MDVDEETSRFKLMMVVAIVFLISAFLSCREMKYVTSGKEVDAKLVRVYTFEEVGRRGRVREKIGVDYEFKDAKTGDLRRETDTLPITATPPKGPAVKVQYLEGTEGSSRLAGHAQTIWLWVCGGTLAFLGYKFFALVREGKR